MTTVNNKLDYRDVSSGDELDQGTIIYPFSTLYQPDLDQVGGKAMSLIQMTQRGLPVPPGFVLSVAFFQPWLSKIRGSGEWKLVLDSPPEHLKMRCDEVKEKCKRLELDHSHRLALVKALEILNEQNATSDAGLFAVRSSSPEEDLEELSFAGGYQTSLGVTLDEIEEAVRVSFASCFDERVFVYKRENGLAMDAPSIAVIVQQQIASEVSGVAFSLNPLNNCYDEAVISANFGLGESVVSGQVSPDTYLVDRVKRSVKTKKIGAKECAIWLGPDGGTYEQGDRASDQYCLIDEQVLQISSLLDIAEDFYGRPIDIEWAYSGGKLYLLQARPITAYVPLPEELLTAPGEQKRLYLDLTLTKWGMPEPLSVMGMDYMKLANRMMLTMTLGAVSPEGVQAVRPTFGGRTYVNCSYSIKFQGQKRFAGGFDMIDAAAAETIGHQDMSEYLPDKLPPELNGIIFKMIRSNLGTLWGSVMALRKPEKFRERYLEAERIYEKSLEEQVDPFMSMETYAETTMQAMLDYIKEFMSLLIANEIARMNLTRLFRNDPSEVQDRLLYLERALPDNVTIEMGLEMFRLACFNEIKFCASESEFVERLEKRNFSSKFLQAWETFMHDYGFRGPMEMDPAAPRFSESPEQFFSQLHTLAENIDPENNPHAIYLRAKAEREQAYQDLLAVAQQKGKRNAASFAKNYRILMHYGGFRETPKYYYVRVVDLFRRRVLSAAQDLVARGQLDRVEQVFDLHIDELDAALADPTLDLRALAEKNTRFLRKIKHVREFPRVIDSRGKILRPPKKEMIPGEIAGEPISPGLVRGPVKVLHSPNEKPILPGDILVTRATDPGWTPLFINASGVILEIGGLLQHGALVAREYGKPCVAGIERVSSLLTDGQMVELDGTQGVVRLM